MNESVSIKDLSNNGNLFHSAGDYKLFWAFDSNTLEYYNLLWAEMVPF